MWQVWQAVFVLVVALFVGILGWLLAGQAAGFVGVIVVLFLWGIYHSIHTHRLSSWLDGGAVPTAIVPAFDRGVGGWQLIFDQLSLVQNKQTKHKQRLSDAIHRLNRMMASLPSALVIINEKGGIEWKNAKADDYLGLQASKLSIRQQVNDEHFAALFDDAIANGGCADVKFNLNAKTLLMTIIPIEARATMLIANDISDSERLNNSKNIFIANVSHELRTPLTVIQGFLEMLENDGLEQELRHEFVGLMQKETSRMMALVEGLLTLSRLENDQKPLEDAVPVNLSDMIAGICDEALRLGKTHHITSHIAADVWVDGVPKDLYSVFSNLIFNAIRHTESGTQIEVNLSADDEIVFFVKDDGEGIASEHLVHLTERFYRVDQGRSRKTGGSGLGLAIAKHAIGRHQGVLKIASQVGQGSQFTVILPKNRLVKN